VVGGRLLLQGSHLPDKGTELGVGDGELGGVTGGVIGVALGRRLVAVLIKVKLSGSTNKIKLRTPKVIFCCLVK